MMRRGHCGLGGWRNENPRSFKPRGGGNQNFRAPRPFGHLDSPRFPPPGPRQYRGPRPFSQHPGRQDNVLQSEHHDRNNYRLNNAPRNYDRGFHHRGQMPPFNHQPMPNEDHGDSYNESNYYQNPNQCHVNNLGDIDHRRQPISPWAKPPQMFENNRPHYYDDHRSPHKTPKHFNMGDDLPDYTGHRPPASDHYSTPTGPNNNNSQYSHSVDDTVDIVRKRLQNRDKQQSFDSSMVHPSNVDEGLRKSTNDNYQSVPQEAPVKKRTHRQKQNIKSNCDKMKNKIVHQLFKMDKTKIHKLMDDPSSSTKFEYAISSLITEGENSLNRHLRSAAEKSLCSSSSDFIHDNTNTIYEDTFMKQMQGILDPQDTVLLEDIKPLVMAELSRVLQLDNYQFGLIQDQGFQSQEMQHEMTLLPEQGMQDFEHEFVKDQPDFQYYDEGQNTEQFSQDTFYEHNDLTERSNSIETMTGDVDNRFYDYEQGPSFDSKPLFERRPANKVDVEKRKSSESRHSKSSSDRSFGHLQEHAKTSPEEQPQLPLFNPNTDHLSDEDDPFAEFDKQYHVAVDHNFIGNENASRVPSPVFSFASDSKSPSEKLARNEKIEIPTTTMSKDIKKELDVQLQKIPQEPITLLNSAGKKIKLEPKIKLEVEVNKESGHIVEKENLLAASCASLGTNTNHTPSEESSKKIKSSKNGSSDSTKSVLQSNTRKRSTEHNPSHRKEKRKRSSHSECQETAKSILNMFYSSDSSRESKASKKPDSTANTYSDKYVKRKGPQKKVREKSCEASNTNEENKHDSNTPSHSNISPKDNHIEETSKTDPKTKLKPIDIFVTQLPKKGSTHQAHRNTAPTPQTAKSPDNKPKLIVPTATSFARKLSKRHISTQVILKHKSKECQTERLKKTSRHTQTDPISPSNVSTNPLERMKEIDMEIQLLLQEKFKLYNSLETKAATVPMDTIPNLSMRVFKVNTEQAEDQQSTDSADAIVNDFANIPVEELEQIAMETIADVKPDTSTKKGRRHKVVGLTRNSSASPTTKRYKKKSKSPNISLIEQIITDDRPIEDIISLDALENIPVKSKKKHPKVPKKKTSKKPKSSKLSAISSYDIKKCSVVLERIDITRILRTKEHSVESSMFTYEVPIIDMTEESVRDEDEHKDSAEASQEDPAIQQSIVEVVEDVVNDLQFDMLDVSEDIVIGDNCEVKTIDKVKETISEEIILDNSQSSMEDMTETTGNENECKMYDYSNENLRRDTITVTGNADAVLAIECIDNDFIAACLDGSVYHFSGEGQLLNTFRGTNQAVTCLTIVKEKYGTTLYTGSLDSRMRYYDLETGLEKGPECNVLSPIQTMDRAWDTIFIGTRTGFVLQFECKNNMVIPVSTVKFSDQSILALRAMKEGPRKVLLVAARSENVVTVKDAQTGLLLRTLQGPKMTVYTLLYEDGKVYCGTSSHNIHVFDYTTGGHVGCHEGGKGAVCLRASGGLVFSGCYDGCVYVYREGETRPRAQLRGPALMLLSLAIHGTKIIAGYKDRGLYIWKMPPAIVQEMIL